MRRRGARATCVYVVAMGDGDGTRTCDDRHVDAQELSCGAGGPPIRWMRIPFFDRPVRRPSRPSGTRARA
jgi:hypothetical protein